MTNQVSKLTVYIDNISDKLVTRQIKKLQVLPGLNSANGITCLCYLFQENYTIDANGSKAISQSESAPKHFSGTIRDVRGHRQKTRKNSEKLGKNVKNRLNIREKAEILGKENFTKTRKSAEKRKSHTPVQFNLHPHTIIAYGQEETMFLFQPFFWGGAWSPKHAYHLRMGCSLTLTSFRDLEMTCTCVSLL